MHDVPSTREEAELFASRWPVRTLPVDVDVDVDLNLNLNATVDIDLVVERFANVHGLDFGAIELRAGDVSRTITIAPGMACATYARGADQLATLALALHEAGHALFRAQMPGSTKPATEPPRWLDEAVAAWAVRALEDPRVIPDAAIRAESRRRRFRREAITARLAAFEAAVAAGARVEDAWPPDLDPSDYPVLRSEPGVMAAYAAADRWPRRVVPRKVRP